MNGFTQLGKIRERKKMGFENRTATPGATIATQHLVNLLAGWLFSCHCYNRAAMISLVRLSEQGFQGNITIHQ